MIPRELSQELIEKIQGAPLSKTDGQVAAELNLHRNTVRKYRVRARKERQEAAREIIAQHVEENIPDALADLTALRRMVKATYEETRDAKDGALWLNSIKTTLEHVKPDDRDIDAAIEAELALLADGDQAAIPRQAPVSPSPAFH